MTEDKLIFDRLQKKKKKISGNILSKLKETIKEAITDKYYDKQRKLVK